MIKDIERIAKALAKSDNRLSWDETAARIKNMYRENAKAALEAMLEPSDEAIEAGMNALSLRYNYRDEIKAAHKAIIKHMIGDEK